MMQHPHLTRPYTEHCPSPDGKVLTAPVGFIFVPADNPGRTWRVKAAGAHGVVQKKKGQLRKEDVFIGLNVPALGLGAGDAIHLDPQPVQAAVAWQDQLSPEGK